MRLKYLFLIVTLLYVETVSAYVGPGLGVGVIGAVVGVIATVLLAILGIIWYPLKRLLKKSKPEKSQGDEIDES